MKLIKAVRGTKDILGEDALKYVHISNVFQKVAENYGYSLIKTPIFEETDLFKRGIGEATDVVEKEMYTFKDKGDRSITLRPENTASIVRAYLEHSIYAKEDISRFYYNGSMFRYERPQAGRQREFNQIGAEVFGEKSPVLDAEVITMGYEVISQLGITDLMVYVNSVGSNESRTIYREALVNYFTPHKEHLCEDCNSRLVRNPLRLLDCKVEKCRVYIDKAPTIIDYLFPDEKKHYDEVKRYLEIFNIPYIENSSLVRGLDYYSSTVFEIVTNKLGAQGTILGGGRYDNLLKQLGDKNIPAFGWAAGIERMMMLISEYPTNSPDVYMAWIGGETLNKSNEIASILRKNDVKVQIDYNERALKNHLKKANNFNAKVMIIIGDEELEKQKVIVRNLEERTQKEIAIDNLEEIIQEVKNAI